MGGIKFSVHPLFFAVGFYYALTGRIFAFSVYSVTTLLHETGHLLAAERAGYKLNKITLTPFGAVAFGNADGLKFYDEIFIALAGPFFNLAIGVFTVAIWWIFPELYAFTDIVAEANFTIALINLIPAYPLDGGRVLSALLGLSFGREKAFKICKILGIVFSVILSGVFVFTVFYKPNFSILFFAVFVLLGATLRDKENKLIKVDKTVDERALKRGVAVKKQAISENASVKQLIKILDPDAFNEIDVYCENGKVKKLSQKEINVIIQKGSVYSAIKEFLQ